MKLVVEPKCLTFDRSLKERWLSGDRSDCIDPYCQKLTGNYGFGEYLVGRHFEEQGYLWIHHDFDVFGGNKLGKYPKAEEVLIKCRGEEFFKACRNVYATLYPFRERGKEPFEQPDLMIYKPDYSELRFAECKRMDTKDKINRKQVIGFFLLSAFLRCDIDLFLLSESPMGKIRDFCFEI